jgi:hypothetical protein
VTGEYDMTQALDGMLGISGCSDLELLKRADSTSGWSVVPCGKTCYDSEVTWTGIQGGFSQFGIGSTVLPTVSIPFGPGWNLFTYPCSPPAEPTPVLEPAISPFYTSPLQRSNICGYSESNETYWVPPVLKTGVAYWVFSPSPETLWVSLASAYFTTAAETTLTLVRLGTGQYQGWNFVGNPFWGTICWDETIKTNVDSTYYVYNPVGHGWLYYNPLTPGLGGRTALIEPGLGFEVQAQPGGGTLTMFNRILPSPVPKPVATAEEASGGWHLQMIATCDAGKSDPQNYVGVDPRASTGYDGMDVHDLLPMDNDAVMLYFPHPDWKDGRAGNYTQDFRPPFEGETEWQFEVKCGLTRQRIQLTWPNIGSIADASLTLVDLGKGTSVDMQAQPSYAFTYGEALEPGTLALTEAPGHRFALLARSATLTGAAADASVPRQFKLGHPWPNPFNPTGFSTKWLSLPGYR